LTQPGKQNGVLTLYKQDFMKWLAASCLMLLISCATPNRFISYPSQTIPIYTIEPQPEKILLLNIFDVKAMKYRDNKEELFEKLIDSTMNWAAEKVHEKAGVNTQVINGYTTTAGNADSTISALLSQNKATHAIVLNSFDVLFYQTHVDVNRNTDGSKNRVAYYNIESNLNYSFYSADSLIKTKDIHQSRFHSSRSVASGLLAAGPNIVVQKDDAYRIARDNWQEYLINFFPGEKMRNRPLFTGKGFESIKLAISKQDYEAALIESMRLVDDPDKTKAAKACYNCAVFFERKNQPAEAKKYLRQSLLLASLYEAKQMLIDFE